MKKWKLALALMIGFPTAIGGMPFDTSANEVGDGINSEFSDKEHVHVVQKGDTLMAIAREYNVDFIQLLNANHHFHNPDLIKPNEKVFIPHWQKDGEEASGEEQETSSTTWESDGNGNDPANNQNPNVNW